MSAQPAETGEQGFVPHPVVKHIVTVVRRGQQQSAEQRGRVVAWLRANGIDPNLVAQGDITLEYGMFGDGPGRQLIGFTQFYVEDGQKVHAEVENDAVKFHRYVAQRVPLEPDPSWPGWDAFRAEQARQREGV